MDGSLYNANFWLLPFVGGGFSRIDNAYRSEMFGGCYTCQTNENRNVFEALISSCAQTMPHIWSSSLNHIDSRYDAGIYTAFIANTGSANCSKIMSELADAYTGRNITSLSADLLSLTNRDLLYVSSHCSECGQIFFDLETFLAAERILWAVRINLGRLLIRESEYSIITINKHVEKHVLVRNEKILMDQTIAQLILSFVSNVDMVLHCGEDTYSIWSGGAFSGGRLPAMYTVNMQFRDSAGYSGGVVAEKEMLNYIFPFMMEVADAWKKVYKSKLNEGLISLSIHDFVGNGNFLFIFSIQRQFWGLIIEALKNDDLDLSEKWTE
eukprot:305338_1